MRAFDRQIDLRVDYEPLPEKEEEYGNLILGAIEEYGEIEHVESVDTETEFTLWIKGEDVKKLVASVKVLCAEAGDDEAEVKVTRNVHALVNS